MAAAITLATAGLGARVVLAAPAVAGNNPQVFTGIVVTTSGAAVRAVTVDLYVAPKVPGAATRIETAVTGANGRWSFPAPSYAKLPKAARQAAAANMGYLNVEAIAVSGSALALAVESAWVGTATASAETGSVKPMAMRMKLEDVAGPAVNPPCCRGKDGCVASQTGVLGKSHSYSVVGEYHAYWNAAGALTYTRGAASSIGSYASLSGTGWSFNGYDTFSTSQTLSMGISAGPYNSHRMAVSLKYVKTSWAMENADSGVKCYTWDQIDEDGIYNPGHGWFVFKNGANVIKDDGEAAYKAELKKHPAYVNGVQPGGSFSISKGNALTYGVAATVFGIQIQATTTHSTDVAQEYAAGSSGARTHWVWGSNGPWTRNPQVVYSY